MLSTSLLLSILLILVLGKILGIAAERMGMPSLVGELLTGIILGPMMLGIIHPAAAGSEDPLKFLSDLGILFMMFLMGLSIDIESVMKTNSRSAASITIIGAAIVLAFSTALMAVIGMALGQDLYTSVIQGCLIGVGLTSTSTVIGFRYLSEIGDRFSNVFKTLVAVEVTDGIFSIMALAVLLSIVGLLAKGSTGAAIDTNGFMSEVGWSTFKLFLLMLGFMIFVIKFGGVVTDWLLGVSRKSRDEQSIITLSLIVLFAVATLSDWLELTYVIGAFLAGAILAGSPYSSTVIEPRIKAIGYGLFIPIFFAYTGISMDFSALFKAPSIRLTGNLALPCYLLLFLGLLVIVMAGKYIGTRAGCALSGGYKGYEAHRIGVSLMCAGEDALVIVGIGASISASPGGQHIISNELLSIVGLIVIVSSLLAPIFMKRSYEEKDYTPPVAPRTKTSLNGKSKGRYRSL
ncbi:cation:proton antiporter [Methanocella conradii]|uniref:cation:proton antiporter n=1 Tax=Methanocella conradii TaxID=1175444 RepID=UPI00157BDF6A|nr:cation:proton antiporter [Methanocella conradii]